MHIESLDSRADHTVWTMWACFRRICVFSLNLSVPFHDLQKVSARLPVTPTYHLGLVHFSGTDLRRRFPGTLHSIKRALGKAVIRLCPVQIIGHYFPINGNSHCSLALGSCCTAVSTGLFWRYHLVSNSPENWKSRRCSVMNKFDTTDSEDRKRSLELDWDLTEPDGWWLSAVLVFPSWGYSLWLDACQRLGTLHYFAVVTSKVDSNK